MKDIVEYIAKSLVDYPNEVEVVVENEANIDVIHIKALKSDMGKIIGKGGKIATSIRTIVKTLAQKQNKKIVVKIEEK